MGQKYPGGIEDCSRFQELVELFESEEQRSYYYDKAQEEVEDVFDDPEEEWFRSEDLVYGGLMMLLYSWNFAATETKQMEGDRLKDILENHHEEIEEVRNISLLDADLGVGGSVHEVVNSVFPELKEHLGQTGTAKALSLLNPDLFVMWDTAIRDAGKQGADVRGVKYYMQEQGFYDGNLSDFDGDKENYLDYLRYCQQILVDAQDCYFIQEKDSTPAKLLDEALYAYYKIENEE